MRIGCTGGNPGQAIEWIEAGNPLCTEESWPYTSGGGREEECSSTCHPVVTVGGLARIPEEDEATLVEALKSAPVAVAIEADHTSFQLYKGGTYDDVSCGTKLDHAVLLTGFGADESGMPYYILKNSWGTSWGMGGYMYLRRNQNTCGVATMPVVPQNVQAVAGPASPRPPTPPFPPPTPPNVPPPGAASLLDAGAVAFFSACLSLLVTLFALLISAMCCKPANMLMHVCVGEMPANIARIISGIGVMRTLLPDNPVAWEWAGGWQCHVTRAGNTANLVDVTTERNCAVLGLAHLVSISSALWACAISIHLLARIVCTPRTSPVHCLRWLVCNGVPIVLCVLAVIDRWVCAPPGEVASSRPEFCTSIGSPHLGAWADLANGMFASGLAARGGDAWPLAVLAAPRALAFVLGILALLSAACSTDRLYEQRFTLQAAAVSQLEPLSGCLVFLGVSVMFWMLGLCHVVEQRWLMGSGETEMLPWLAMGADATLPAVGTIAAVCWWCSTSPRTARDARVRVRMDASMRRAAGINATGNARDSARTSLLDVGGLPPPAMMAPPMPVYHTYPTDRRQSAFGADPVAPTGPLEPLFGSAATAMPMAPDVRAPANRLYPDAR